MALSLPRLLCFRMPSNFPRDHDAQDVNGSRRGSGYRFGGFHNGRPAVDRRQWVAQREEMYHFYAQQRAAKMDALKEQYRAIEAISDPERKKQERRRFYRCGAQNVITVTDIPTWADSGHAYHRRHDDTPSRMAPAASSVVGPRGVQLELDDDDDARRFRNSDGEALRPVDTDIQRFSFRPDLNQQVSLFRGDITSLELDAIVNAANSSLLGGGGIDGAIHDAAGPLLLEECKQLRGCETGHTKITNGYYLPATYVLHTVGPIGHGDDALESCYQSILDIVAASHGGEGADRTDSTPTTSTTASAGGVVSPLSPTPIRTLGICCISTGIFSFPRVRATHIALRTVRQWMERHPKLLTRVVFVVFNPQDLLVYQALLPSYFPLSDVDVCVAGRQKEMCCKPEDMFPYVRSPPPSTRKEDGNGERRFHSMTVGASSSSSSWSSDGDDGDYVDRIVAQLRQSQRQPAKQEPGVVSSSSQPRDSSQKGEVVMSAKGDHDQHGEKEEVVDVMGPD